MKTSLRTLTGALAAASALTLVPAVVSGSPAPERATGGPGASATLRNGVLTMRASGSTTRLHVPSGYHLPAVTTRGLRGGVSFDGQTVVLAYGGQQTDGRSRFLVAERGQLTPLTFRGRVAFDALAPSGSAIYLIRRTSASDPTRYVVLQYNRGDHTLNRVAVKVEFSAGGAGHPDGYAMQGLPLARTTSEDGSWAYTLYDARAHPFIHALPLGQGAWAACIELPPAWRDRVGTLQLRAREYSTVEVLNADGRVVATADLHSMKLSLAGATPSS
jgi:hypothetical protein